MSYSTGLEIPNYAKKKKKSKSLKGNKKSSFVVSLLLSQKWFLCSFLSILPVGSLILYFAWWSFLDLSCIFPRPQTPWRHCFPHLWAFTHVFTYQVLGKSGQDASNGPWMESKDYTPGMWQWQQWGWAAPIPLLGSIVYTSLVTPALRVPSSELCGEEITEGPYTKQGAGSWHQKTQFCIWLPEGSSCSRGRRGVGIQLRWDPWDSRGY